jgi:hypothetical protein
MRINLVQNWVEELKAKVPATGQVHSARTDRPILPEFLSYVLSFVFVGIYWSGVGLPVPAGGA